MEAGIYPFPDLLTHMTLCSAPPVRVSREPSRPILKPIKYLCFNSDASMPVISFGHEFLKDDPSTSGLLWEGGAHTSPSPILGVLLSPVSPASPHSPPYSELRGEECTEQGEEKTALRAFLLIWGSLDDLPWTQGRADALVTFHSCPENNGTLKKRKTTFGFEEGCFGPGPSLRRSSPPSSCSPAPAPALSSTPPSPRAVPAPLSSTLLAAYQSGPQPEAGCWRKANCPGK